MMGHSHAITGAVTWTATVALVTPSAMGIGGTAAVVGVVVTGALVAAGSAIAADLDQQESIASYSLPPITTLLSALIGLLAGGHRRGTHSLIGVAIFMFGAYALSWWSITVNGVDYAPGPAIATVLLAALAFRALKLGTRTRQAWGLSLLAGIFTWFAVPHVPVEPWTWSQPSWFVIAAGVGYVTHLIGDAMTNTGIPVLWPLKRKVLIPLIPHTGKDSAMEHIVLAVWVVLGVGVASFGFGFLDSSPVA